MKHSRSSSRKRFDRSEAEVGSGSAEISDGRWMKKFHLRALIDTDGLSSLIEQIPEAVVVLNTQNRILHVSKEFIRMFGYQKGEVLGRSIFGLILPAPLAESREQFTPRGRVELETVCKRKSGADVCVSILAAPITAASGETVAIYMIYRDVTEQKRAEELLRESEARFRAIADTAPVMIWTTGTDGLCNYFNKPWLDFTGRAMEQEVGTGWIEGVHPDDVQACADGYWPAFEARESFRIEYRLKRRDGEYRWVIESGVPRYTAPGEFAGYIGSNIDVTDLKRVEDEDKRLRQLQNDLAHRNRVATLGELSASLGHELKQPIAAAAMNAQACVRWLSGDSMDVGEAREAAGRLVAAVSRTTEIIARVNSLYRRTSAKREPVDLNAIIGEMIGLLHETTSRSSVSVRTDLDSRLPMIAADRIQLQQVLMNLMLNGIEAMKDAGGELAVASKRTDDSQILVSVIDQGDGLSAEHAERIFEAFFTTKPDGTGMGLAISRAIIESHGGRLRAKSNVGRGATLEFTLPVQNEFTS